MPNVGDTKIKVIVIVNILEEILFEGGEMRRHINKTWLYYNELIVMKDKQVYYGF